MKSSFRLIWSSCKLWVIFNLDAVKQSSFQTPEFSLLCSFQFSVIMEGFFLFKTSFIIQFFLHVSGDNIAKWFCFIFENTKSPTPYLCWTTQRDRSHRNLQLVFYSISVMLSLNVRSENFEEFVCLLQLLFFFILNMERNKLVLTKFLARDYLKLLFYISCNSICKNMCVLGLDLWNKILKNICFIQIQWL